MHGYVFERVSDDYAERHIQSDVGKPEIKRQPKKSVIFSTAANLDDSGTDTRRISDISPDNAPINRHSAK